jgi:hypothetical protein
LKIVEFAKVNPGEWDFVVQNSPWGWLFHLSDWLSLERRYWFPESHSFMVQSDQGEPLAILPLYVSEQGLSRCVERLLHSGIHRHTGLAAVPSLGRRELKRLQTFVMKEVFRIACEVKADRIQLNEQNLAPGNMPPYRIEIPFFVEDFHFYFGIKFSPNSIDPAPNEMTCCSDQIVMVDQSEEELFANLEQSARWGVQRGKREGIKISEASSADDLKHFTDLRLDAQQRTGQAAMPDTYYADVFQRFYAPGRCRVLLAKLKDKVIGGVQILVYKKSGAYFAGFGLNEYLALQYNDLLQWNAILWSKQQGLKCYRLGPHFPDAPLDAPIYKKGRFKKKFGGQPFHVLQGSYFLSPGKYAQTASVDTSIPSPCDHEDSEGKFPEPIPFDSHGTSLWRRFVSFLKRR